MGKKILIIAVLLFAGFWGWNILGPIGTGEVAYNKAEAALHALKYEKAARAYKAAIAGQLEEKHRELAYYRLASALQEQHLWKEAISAFEEAMHKYPNSHEANRAQGQVEKIRLEQDIK